MEMLFNIDISDSAVSQIVSRIKNSALEDYSHENALINEIYRLQEEESFFIEKAVSYAEEIYENSSKDISCKMSKVVSTGVPTVKPQTAKLDPIGLDNTTGLITPSHIVDIYTRYYWKMGDYVEILNNSVVPATFNPSLDAIMTREILESHFLRRLPRETLSRCMTSYLGGTSIESQLVHNERAINYSDLKRLFYLKTDTISVAYNTIFGDSVVVREMGIEGDSFVIPYTTTATKIIARNGVVTLGIFKDEFLIAGGYISDNSNLKKNATTNAVTLGTATDELSSYFAPKRNWKAEDLRKSDTKDEGFMDSLASDVLNNIAPDESNRDYYSPVSKQELSYCIDKIMDIIGEIRCDENTEVGP